MGMAFLKFFDRDVLLCIIGCVIGYLVSVVQKSRRLLKCNFSAKRVIGENTSKINGIKITLNDEAITDLVITTVTITNSGNVAVRKSDFPSSRMLTLKSTARIYKQNCYIKAQPKGANASLNFFEDNEVRVNFEYLKSRRKMTFVIFHSGILHCDGELIDGAIYVSPAFLRKLGSIPYFV